MKHTTCNLPKHSGLWATMPTSVLFISGYTLAPMNIRNNDAQIMESGRFEGWDG
jgi:hypothetical protein